LQGVALAVLIGQFNPLPPLSSDSWLRFLDTLLGIALIWYLYANAFITFLWPFDPWHIFLQFSLVTVESVACLKVQEPEAWTLAVGLTALIGALIRRLNARIVSKDNYEREDVYQLDRKMEICAAYQLAGLAGLSFLLCGMLAWASSQPICVRTTATWLSAALLLMALCFIMCRARKATQLLIEKHLEGSVWDFEDGLLVERKTKST